MDTFVSDLLVYRHRGARLFAWREPTFPARFVRFGGVLDSPKTAILGAGPARRAKRPGIVPGPLSRLYGYARCKWALLAHVTAKCGRACEVHLAASSTINGNDRAGHVGTHVARQVDKGIGDVLGLADTTERDGGDERLMTSSGSAATMSVLVTPGATAFTRMPLGASSRDRLCVRPLTAYLEVGYPQPEG